MNYFKLWLILPIYFFHISELVPVKSLQSTKTCFPFRRNEANFFCNSHNFSSLGLIFYFYFGGHGALSGELWRAWSSLGISWWSWTYRDLPTFVLTLWERVLLSPDDYIFDLQNLKATNQNGVRSSLVK